MKDSTQKSGAYKQAGVDIEAAANLIERIKPHVKTTDRNGVMSGLGGFGALFDLKETGYKDPILVSSTDGVGTKIKIAIESGLHDKIGIDLVAMCVNDLVVQGAEPLFFLDYFATGKLENDVAERVIAGIAAGCRFANCALIGGETAEMPGMYGPGDYDLAGFTVGVVERDQMITGETIKPGDMILGLASSGVHSNGFSLVRRIVESGKASYDAPAPYDSAKTLAESLLTPTRIYVRPLLETLREKNDEGKPVIKGMAHITGGGLVENVPRVLPAGTIAQIDAAKWKLPPVFKWLKKVGGLTDEDMSLTLNCGIGMVVICDPSHAPMLANILSSHGEKTYIIGEIKAASDAKTAPVVEMMNTQESWA